MVGQNTDENTEFQAGKVSLLTVEKTVKKRTREIACWLRPSNASEQA